MVWRKYIARRRIVIGFIILAFFAASVFSGMKIIANLREQEAIDKALAKGEFPRIHSYDNLKKLLAEFISKKDIPPPVVKPSSESESGYLETNTQVKGIEEGDIVKTDGEFIYRIRSRRYIDIIKAYPAETASKAATINLTGYAADLYIKDNYLIIIYNGEYGYIGMNKASVSDRVYPGSVSVQILDIKDKTNPKVLREITVAGGMVSSRMIDKRLYLILEKNIDLNIISKKESRDSILPAYWDSLKGGSRETLTLEKVSYCPGVVENEFIVIASLNIDNPKEELKVSACLGSVQYIYYSRDNLYISIYGIKQRNYIAKDIFGVADKKLKEITTAVGKFKLIDGVAELQAYAIIPGVMRWQSAMDEQGDEFRIVTRRNYESSYQSSVTSNNIFILDDKMKLKGKVEIIGNNEILYTVRFLGSRAYLDTFSNTETLTVIDLSDGRNPEVSGKLKIPGFNYYFLPYDNNHIIGYGIHNGFSSQRFEGDTSEDKGLKISIFDVSDIKNPKQKFFITIGNDETESEVFQNSKALLFDREKGILALPIWIYTKNRPDMETNYSNQGAYIFEVNPENGFKLKGKISHFEKEGKTNGGGISVQRILCLRGYLYTISNDKIMIHGIQDLNKVGEINY